MNREDVSNEYFAYCNTMKTQFPEYNGFYELCGMFARNLKKISKIMEYERNDNEHKVKILFSKKKKLYK